MDIKKIKRYKNISLNIRGNTKFGQKIQKSKKGKGSYSRKTRCDSYLIDLEIAA